jgi:hypothetical protein
VHQRRCFEPHAACIILNTGKFVESSLFVHSDFDLITRNSKFLDKLVLKFYMTIVRLKARKLSIWLKMQFFENFQRISILHLKKKG